MNCLISAVFSCKIPMCIHVLYTLFRYTVATTTYVTVKCKFPVQQSRALLPPTQIRSRYSAVVRVFNCFAFHPVPVPLPYRGFALSFCIIKNIS